MKKLLVLTLLHSSVTLSQAAKINGSYPICKSAEDIQQFAQAKMFTNVAEMQQIVERGDCTFVGKEISATIIESTMYPKVLVFIPFKNPMVGWTINDNLR